MNRRTCCLVAIAGWLCVPGWSAAQPKTAGTRDGIELFEAKIRPVLVKHCYECHSAKAAKVKGGLYVDHRAGLLQGGDGGPALVPGNPKKSLIIQALRHEQLKMPPKQRLSDGVIADFEQWIRLGAPDPRTADGASWKRLTHADAKNHWSFKPVQKHEPPLVKDVAWAKTDVDRFVLARLEARGLRPAAEADRASLLRRLSFDLTGLPPTPEESDGFVKDTSPQAVEKVVDRLLASKHYGERWGRHWLDLARYAESNGNTDNTLFPHAWRYRDWVIASFNDDKPYNRFIQEQIAGDLLPAATPEQKDAHLIATGFLALTSKPRAQGNPDYRQDLIADQLDVTCRTVLGLTIICARCHDHKFDPILTREYYALAGFFDSSEMLSGGSGKGAKKENGGGDGLHTLSSGGLAMGIREGKPTDTAIALRGDSTTRGEVSPRGFLGAVRTAHTPEINRNQSGRLELAHWLTQPDHPLTSRVIVNRVWQHLFGQGLSRVVDNFGLHGAAPTHPELLDYLASTFQDDGWSIKKLIRRIVLTRTYQMSSGYSDASYKADPDNTLWWRAQPRRLDAEAIRDAMLAAAGTINLAPPARSLAYDPDNKKGAPAEEKITHRSVYLGIIRNGLPETLAIFDVADPSLIVGQRDVTTVPSQALYLMNSPFVTEQARLLAERIQKAAPDDAARVDLAHRLALGRPATPAETQRALSFIRAADNQGWQAFCHALLASAEFRYLQ
jgi:hypothetical protein